jgi:hypothetical protein
MGCVEYVCSMHGEMENVQKFSLEVRRGDEPPPRPPGEDVRVELSR